MIKIPYSFLISKGYHKALMNNIKLKFKAIYFGFNFPMEINENLIVTMHIPKAECKWYNYPQ